MRFTALLFTLTLAAPLCGQIPVAALLERCTSIPDVTACHAVLRRKSTPQQKSLALTYIEDAKDFRSDSILNVAIRYDSTNALAHYLLGRMSYRPIGMKHMLIAQRLRPDWTFIPRQMAEQFGLVGTSPGDTVTMLWQRVAELEPANADAQATYGLTMLWSKPQEAARVFRRALQLNTDNHRARGGLCMALLNAGEAAAAREQCPGAIPSIDFAGIELYNLAGAAERLKEYDVALQATERGLLFEPTSSVYRSSKTRILEAMGRAKEAEDFLRSYVAARPGDFDALNELGNFYYFQNRLPEARDVYRKLLAQPCAGAMVPLEEVRNRVKQIDEKVKSYR